MPTSHLTSRFTGDMKGELPLSEPRWPEEEEGSMSGKMKRGELVLLPGLTGE